MTDGWRDLETLIRLITVGALVIVGVRFGTDLYQDLWGPALTFFGPAVRMDIDWWLVGVLCTLLSAAWFTWPRSRTP